MESSYYYQVISHDNLYYIPDRDILQLMDIMKEKDICIKFDYLW